MGETWRRSCRCAEAIALVRPRRRHRRHGGLHPPDPARRRARGDPSAAPRPDPGPDDPGRDLRPDDRRRLRPQAGLLLGRQSRRRLPAPVPRRRRSTPGPARSSSRSTATPAWPTGTSRAPPGCRSPCCAGTAAPAWPSRTPNIAEIACPFTGETLTAVAAPAAGRDRDPRAARGPRRERPVLGDHRRAEGGRAGGRRSPWSPSRRSSTTLDPRPGAVVLPSWTVGYVAAAPGGAHPSYALGYTARDNDFYIAWDAISRDRDTFSRWLDEHVLRRAARQAASTAGPALSGEGAQ